MIQVTLHHLKPEGKSGTVLVGNIECDVHVALNITLAQPQSKVINQLEPLWAGWSRSHSLSLYSLEMHKSPKLILYNPRQPSIGTNEPVLQEFFVRATPKDPTPKFFANARVAILLEQCVNNIAPSVDTDVQNVLTPASSIPAKKRVLQSQGSSNDSSPSPPRRPAHKRSRKFLISEISEVLAGNNVSKDEDQSNVSDGPSKLEYQSQLKAAMKTQGNVRKQASSTIGAGCVSITFRLFDIPSIGFPALISTPFSTIDSKYTVAALTINTRSKSMIGLAGSFKTCHPALISNADVVPSMSTSPPPSVLSAEQVVAKCVVLITKGLI
ncbi:uncharacterized protein EDB93DRAFT_1252092 [Suillus bovinus]|uniref:uncharacterized protein n=1 Tax=Suillus bovinus TaxID=48563 RepID=UPI001B87E4C9|nr:uncharacterized protein EDB93DRAFT_1252092 [Suillus bovinus]KAG2142828.1 hypothetical protein EDB93DRAFT_1252092 [Suillus bovinus]